MVGELAEMGHYESTDENVPEIEKLKEFIKNFTVGSIHNKYYPSVTEEDGTRVTTLRALVLGHSNSGKSSIILSILTALEDDGSVQWFRCKVSNNRQSEACMQATTSTTRVYEIALGRGHNKCILQLVDSRGAVADEDFTNDVNYAVGDTSRQQRGNDGAKFTSRIHNVVGEFNVVMVVIPNDFEVPVRKYKELIDGLDKRGCQVVPVFTGTDRKRDCSELLASLNLSETQVLKIVPYNSKNNIQFNSLTNLQALRIVHRLLERGDAEGLQPKVVQHKYDNIAIVIAAICAFICLLAAHGFATLIASKK